MMRSVRCLHNIVQFCEILIVTCQEYMTVSCGVFKMAGVGCSYRSAFGRNEYPVADLPQERYQLSFRAIVVKVKIHSGGLVSAIRET
jgi:hypothetical protein